MDGGVPRPLLPLPTLAPYRLERGESSQKDGVTFEKVRLVSATGSREADLVTPPGRGPFAAVLYVHWLGEPATSHRTEFQAEALQLGQRGVVSLSLEMPWSDAHWFPQLKREADVALTLYEVAALKSALDVLLARPGVDAHRVAYVGHDFGASFGALLAAVDHRPRTFVFISGTPKLSSWFLLGTKPSAKDRYLRDMSAVEPVQLLPGAANASMFFQNGDQDGYVPAQDALAFFAAAPSPKQLAVYPAGHEVKVPKAASDRMAWLSEELGLASPR